MDILIQVLITIIIVLLVFYFFIGYIVSWMNSEIFKSAGVAQMHWLMNIVTIFIWPTMIKETLSGFEDIIALKMGKIITAKNNNNNGIDSGLGSMLGSMFENMSGGGEPNATSEDNNIIDSDQIQ